MLGRRSGASRPGPSVWFRYAVQPGVTDSDEIRNAAVDVTLNGGTIQSPAGVSRTGTGSRPGRHLQSLPQPSPPAFPDGESRSVRPLVCAWASAQVSSAISISRRSRMPGCSGTRARSAGRRDHDRGLRVRGGGNDGKVGSNTAGRLQSQILPRSRNG